MPDNRPVLVLQHLSSDGPAYLQTWLDREGQPAHVVDSSSGADFPAELAGYRALAVLGGAMSANDPLPSLRRAERLIVQAIDRGIPVLGHCLGGQLMARALGAPVSASPSAEVGWQRIVVADDPLARDWFGRVDDATVFQWHREAFGLPPGATALAGNDACPVQAFAIGPHLAMQFHVELDAAKLDVWLAEDDALRREAAASPSVHTTARMRADTARWLTPQQRLADRIYGRWLGLAPPAASASSKAVS